jgi:hypothetical protein
VIARSISIIRKIADTDSPISLVVACSLMAIKRNRDMNVP